MRPDDLAALLERRPFQPLRLHLTDGKQFEIRHPEMALVWRSVVRIFGPAGRGFIVTSRDEIVVSLVHIVLIEFFS